MAVRDCYDTVAGEYAARFLAELDAKPFDRERLDRFAGEMGGRGRVCDLGCGPGHVAGYLAERGVDVFGVDLSAGQIGEARRCFPGLEFRVGDMLALDLPQESVAGIVAFYSIVHFTLAELAAAAREMCRILEPGGSLLLTFHIGTEPVALDEFLSHRVSIEFRFFLVDEVVRALEAAGFVSVSTEERGPYAEDVEAQTRRAYVRAKRRGGS